MGENGVLAEYLYNIYVFLNKVCYLGYKIIFLITAMGPSRTALLSLTTNIEKAFVTEKTGKRANRMRKLSFGSSLTDHRP